MSFHKNNRKAPTSLPVISNVMIPLLSCGTSPFTLTGELIGKEYNKAHVHTHAHVHDHITIHKSNCCHGLFPPSYLCVYDTAFGVVCPISYKYTR